MLPNNLGRKFHNSESLTKVDGEGRGWGVVCETVGYPITSRSFNFNLWHILPIRSKDIKGNCSHTDIYLAFDCKIARKCLSFVGLNLSFYVKMCFWWPCCPHQKRLSKYCSLYFPWLAPQRETSQNIHIPDIWPWILLSLFTFYFSHSFLTFFFHNLFFTFFFSHSRYLTFNFTFFWHTAIGMSKHMFAFWPLEQNWRSSCGIRRIWKNCWTK